MTIANTIETRALILGNLDELLHIYRDGVEAIRGKIDVKGIKYSQTMIEISGYAECIGLHLGFFSSLNGSYAPYDPYRVQFDNTPASTILPLLLAGTSFTVAECPATLISIRGEYESRLQWISAVASACKYESGGDTHSCDWWIDVTGGVHIAQVRGSSQGEVPVQDVLEREVNYSKIQNTVHGLGQGDGINQLSTSKSNTSSVSTYGAREVLFTDRRYTIQASLDGEAQEYADSHAGPKEEISCSMATAIYYEYDLAPGDSITIQDEATGTDGEYRIRKATVSPSTIELELSNVSRKISSEIQALKRQVQVDGSYMQGQTVPLNFSNMDNVESGYPLKLNIHVPAKTKAINAFFLSFDIEKYRAFVSTTSDESDHTHGFSISHHTHSVSIPAHAHSLGLWKQFDTNPIYPVGVQSVGGNNLLVVADDPGVTAAATSEDGGAVSVTSSSGGATSSTSAAGSKHTHTPRYGIMEDADNNPSISIKIDGTDHTSALGGPWTCDQLELDITEYIQTTGKHTIELLSTARARLQADAWGQVFIQSD